MNPAAEDNKISVVLVNWNSEDLTLACLKSLHAGSRRPSKVIVVDNASREGSLDGIAGFTPGVDLVRNTSNLGFAGACNIGIRKALQAGADIVWVLNNDTRVDAKCLEALERAADEHSTVGAFTGKILNSLPSDTLWYGGGKISRLFLTARHRGLGEVDRGQYDHQEDVTFISGCCMFVRRVAWEKAGLFDEAYFAYLEDLEWCLKARGQGLRMLYVPAAVIVHEGSASVRRNSFDEWKGLINPLMHYFEARNRIFTIRKHASNPLILLVAATAYAMETVYLTGGFVLKWRMDKLRSRLKGLRDGFGAMSGGVLF